MSPFLFKCITTSLQWTNSVSFQLHSSPTQCCYFSLVSSFSHSFKGPFHTHFLSTQINWPFLVFSLSAAFVTADHSKKYLFPWFLSHHVLLVFSCLTGYFPQCLFLLSLFKWSTVLRPLFYLHSLISFGSMFSFGSMNLNPAADNSQV